MPGTKASTSDSSSIGWKGHSGYDHRGQRVLRGPTDGSKDGADATYDSDAYDRDRYNPAEYKREGGKMGSHFKEADVKEAVAGRSDCGRKQRQFERMWHWNRGTNPSYEHPDGDEVGSVVLPSDNDGRRALRDKLATVERIADKLNVPSAVRSEARGLAAAADGRGHCLEKVAVGAILVADDRYLANRVARADVDGIASNVVEQLQGDVGDREIDNALNLLEEADCLSSALERRLKRRDEVIETAETYGFRVNDAKSIFYDA